MSVDSKLTPVQLPAIRESLAQHLSNLSSPVDTFFESHVENSNHYLIRIDGVVAGYTSIHDGSLVTQFYLADRFKRYGQPLFQRVKKMESVQRAFVPTCDEFFLAHALDEHRHFELQAYFFQCNDTDIRAVDDDAFSFGQASERDVEMIRQLSGDFFDTIEERVERGELYITQKEGACAGLGIVIMNRFCSGCGDIGMFTAESHRRMGVGTATIRFLMQECKRNQKRPVAGCWYYNHLSKRTLEKAGMYSQTRLLKISY